MGLDLIMKLIFQVSLLRAGEDNPKTPKHILLWTDATVGLFAGIKDGQQVFIDRRCTYTNCFITRNFTKSSKNFTEFDAVVFTSSEVSHYYLKDLPKERAPHQKFVFASTESAHKYPICNNIFDDFFNWTWTYKLDSDVTLSYIVVKNENGAIIGPNREMHWMALKDMQSIIPDVRHIIKQKSEAAIWIASDCDTPGKREDFVEELQKELNNLSLKIDVFDKCGPYECPLNDDGQNMCPKIIERDYYFVLSFEKAISKDYVTDVLLLALFNNAVPIVYGGANYSRFMPPSAFLDAKALGPKLLAQKMKYLIRHRSNYYDYFKWQNHYSYDSPENLIDTDDYCRICALLNNERLVKQIKYYTYIQNWWNEPGACEET